MLDNLKIYEFEIDAKITDVLSSEIYNPWDHKFAIQVTLDFEDERNEYIYNVLLWKKELRKVREVNTLFIYCENEQTQKEAKNKLKNLLINNQELMIHFSIKSYVRDAELKKMKWCITSGNQTIMKGAI